MRRDTGKEKLVRFIENRIFSGEYGSGYRLHSTRFYASQFQISVPTAHSALTSLVEKGVLVRRHGKGTYVSENPPGQPKPLVGIITADRNDYQKRMSHALAEGIQKMNMDARIIKWDFTCSLTSPDLANLLEHDRLRAIICKASTFPITMEISRNFPHLYMISLDPLRHDCFPKTVVYPNLYQASYIATKLFMDLGHTNIGLYCVRSTDCTMLVSEEKAVDGYMAALKEKRLKDNIVSILANRHDQENIHKYLTSPNRPTAIYSMYDHRTLEIMNEAKKLGIAIPEDLAIISGGNSSVAESLDITSVDFKQELMVDNCVNFIQLAINKKVLMDSWVECLVKPELVLRKTHGQ